MTKTFILIKLWFESGKYLVIGVRSYPGVPPIRSYAFMILWSFPKLLNIFFTWASSSAGRNHCTKQPTHDVDHSHIDCDQLLGHPKRSLFAAVHIIQSLDKITGCGSLKFFIPFGTIQCIQFIVLLWHVVGVTPFIHSRQQIF
jgi:hypothetical protein